MATHTYLGIDFGTTNSFFCTSDASRSVTKIKLEEAVSSGSLPTAVLWRTGVETAKEVVCIGQHAVYKFARSGHEERKDYRLAVQFKPDLAHSKQPEEDTLAFLREARERMVRSGRVLGIGTDKAVQVIIGVPSNWGASEKQLLGDLAKEAGYGQVICAAEPLGALVSHLCEHEVTAQEARKGVLVIDFGGGTLDVALLRNGAVDKSWGDSLLGGRLFDDLFFQWCLDTDPSLLEEWERKGTVFYHHMHACREMKEEFSHCMRMEQDQGSRLESFSYRLSPGPGGLDIQKGAQGEFERRCCNYKASAPLQQTLPDFKTRYARLLTADRTDLFAWIRQSIAQSSEGPLVLGEVSTVICTGGSGAWPFMPLLIKSVFPSAKIIMSPDPEAVVAEGLARLLPLREYNQKTKVPLKEEEPSKIAEFSSELERIFSNCFEGTTEDIAVELYDARIVPILSDFREKGGRLSDLEKRCNAECVAFEPRLPEVVKRRANEVEPIVRRRIKEFLFDWLERHGLTETGRIPAIQPGEVKVAFDSSQLDDILDPIIGAVSGITAVIGGTLCGGGGLALIMHGPIGWVIGAIIVFTAVFLGKKAAREWLKERDLPRWLVRMCLWQSRFDRVITNGREKMKEAIFGNLQTELQKEQDKIANVLKKALDGVIESLTWVDSVLAKF